MEIPDFIDADIVSSVGYWMITAGTWIAFLIGFKMADNGLFGVVDAGGLGIPLLVKILLLILTPVISYFVYGKVALR